MAQITRFLNVTVLDGSGAPGFVADVEIEDDRITAVGQTASAGDAVEIEAHDTVHGWSGRAGGRVLKKPTPRSGARTKEPSSRGRQGPGVGKKYRIEGLRHQAKRGGWTRSG